MLNTISLWAFSALATSAAYTQAPLTALEKKSGELCIPPKFTLRTTEGDNIYHRWGKVLHSTARNASVWSVEPVEEWREPKNGWYMYTEHPSGLKQYLGESQNEVEVRNNQFAKSVMYFTFDAKNETALLHSSDACVHFEDRAEDESEKTPKKVWLSINSLCDPVEVEEVDESWNRAKKICEGDKKDEL